MYWCTVWNLIQTAWSEILGLQKYKKLENLLAFFIFSAKLLPKKLMSFTFEPCVRAFELEPKLGSTSSLTPLGTDCEKTKKKGKERLEETSKASLSPCRVHLVLLLARLRPHPRGRVWQEQEAEAHLLGHLLLHAQAARATNEAGVQAQRGPFPRRVITSCDTGARDS